MTNQLQKMKHQRNFLKEEKEENDKYLRKLIRIFNNKKEHGPNNRNDFDYFGIRDIEIYLIRLMKKSITSHYQ